MPTMRLTQQPAVVPRERRGGANDRGRSHCEPAALAATHVLALQRSIGNRAVTALVATARLQRGTEATGPAAAGPAAAGPAADKERAQEIERRMAGEGFTELERLLAGANPVTIVRLVVRSAAAGDPGSTAGVGHAGIQVQVRSDAGEGAAQLGLDNGGLVKMEGALTEELKSAKYRLTFIERPVEPAKARTFIGVLRGEVGRKHSYLEKLHPGSYYLGYENCTSWAEDMARAAGLSLPRPSVADITAFYPRPTELGARIRGGPAVPGQASTNVDVFGGHRIADAGARGQFDQSNVVNRGGNKWMLVQALVADLAQGAPMTGAEALADTYGVQITAAEYATYLAEAQSVFNGEKKDITAGAS
jgi:hypothetical protein